jgi:hypothetical protein
LDPTPATTFVTAQQEARNQGRWYRDGDVIEVADAITTTLTLTVSMPGTYWVELWAPEMLEPTPPPNGQQESDVGIRQLVKVSESNHVVVLACEESICERSDVSAVIYGGWDGIPVSAWVGGTAQPTLLTEHDAQGLPAVLWTFYPPVAGEWSVSVSPHLPTGLDPARWEYRLIRIASHDGKSTISDPAAASVKISPCCGWKFYFQLVDKGPAGTP